MRNPKIIVVFLVSVWETTYWVMISGSQESMLGELELTGIQLLPGLKASGLRQDWARPQETSCDLKGCWISSRILRSPRSFLEEGWLAWGLFAWELSSHLGLRACWAGECVESSKPKPLRYCTSHRGIRSDTAPQCFSSCYKWCLLN